VELLHSEMPDFIPMDFWPPNSPDPTSLLSDIGNYAGMLHHTDIHSIDELKQQLIQLT